MEEEERRSKRKRGTTRRRDGSEKEREDSDRDVRDDASSTVGCESDEDEDGTFSCERDAGFKFTCTRAKELVRVCASDKEALVQ